MRDMLAGSARRLAAVVITLSLGLAACGGAATSSADSNGGSTSSDAGAGGGGAGASTDSGGGVGSGETTVTGSLVSSGAYDATWTWQPGNAADVGIGGVTLNSDKGTFGSIQVLADGSIVFSSTAPELTVISYQGTGAQVHMKDVSGTQLPCGWTLDNDVTGSDGVVIHLKGSMDIIGTVFECPG
jgi:hypothetical protein